MYVYLGQHRREICMSVRTVSSEGSTIFQILRSSRKGADEIMQVSFSFICEHEWVKMTRMYGSKILRVAVKGSLPQNGEIVVRCDSGRLANRCETKFEMFIGNTRGKLVLECARSYPFGAELWNCTSASLLGTVDAKILLSKYDIIIRNRVINVPKPVPMLRVPRHRVLDVSKAFARNV